MLLILPSIRDIPVSTAVEGSVGRVALKHPQPLSAMFGQSDDMFESISVVPDGDALAADARFLLLNQTAGA